MRYALIFMLSMLAIAGCNARSSKLPTTDKWVRFHCPVKGADKSVFMVEMPGKPEIPLNSLYRRLTSLGEVDAYAYQCGDDGMFMAFAAEIGQELEQTPLDNEESQAMGRQLAERMDAEVTESKSFLFEEKYPALDLAGAQKRGIAGKFRIRVINYKQYLIMLIVVGRANVVREPEVSYFFDSLLLYN